ncbi:MAG: META domain-containing protein [Anaerolineales bacterium]|jgi:heat shock protein HslJ
MNKKSLTILTLLLATGLILLGCASQGSLAGLKGTSWKLISYGPVGKQTPAAVGIETSLEFNAAGEVDGNLGCNSFSGNYVMKGGNVIFSQIISTMMACLGPQMDQERLALKVMNDMVRYQVQGNTLVIYGADGVNAITFSKEK